MSEVLVKEKRKYCSKYYTPKDLNRKERLESKNIARVCLRCDKHFMTYTRYYRMCEQCRVLNTGSALDG